MVEGKLCIIHLAPVTPSSPLPLQWCGMCCLWKEDAIGVLYLWSPSSPSHPSSISNLYFALHGPLRHGTHCCSHTVCLVRVKQSLGPLGYAGFWWGSNRESGQWAQGQLAVFSGNEVSFQPRWLHSYFSQDECGSWDWSSGSMKLLLDLGRMAWESMRGWGYWAAKTFWYLWLGCKLFPVSLGMFTGRWLWWKKSLYTPSCQVIPMVGTPLSLGQSPRSDADVDCGLLVYVESQT